jgi:hypothetical protein
MDQQIEREETAMTQMPEQSPPYEAPQDLPPRQPVWPKVIGIISVVLASLGLVCTPISLFLGMRGANAEEALKYFPDWWLAYTTVSCIVGILQAILLLAAGIVVLLKRPAGRVLHLVYAVITIVLGMASSAIGATGLVTADMPAPIKISVAVGVFIGVLVGMIYPVFLLIWFLRPRIRDQVAAWGR